MASKRSHKKIQRTKFAARKSKKKVHRIVRKKVVKKTIKKKKAAVRKIVEKQPIAFIPEPWSKVTKYKKIRKDGYGGYW